MSHSFDPGRWLREPPTIEQHAGVSVLREDLLEGGSEAMRATLIPDRLSKAREALAELDALVAAEKWSAAEEQCRFAKALLTQAEAECEKLVPRKSIEGRQKFHRGHVHESEEKQ